jgi:hypothetical protein
MEIWFLYFLVQEPQGLRRVLGGEYQTEEQCEVGAYLQMDFARIWLGPDVGWECIQGKSM